MTSLLDKNRFSIRIIRESALIVLVVLATYFVSGELRTRIGKVNSAIVASNNLYGMRTFHKEAFDLMNQHLATISDLKNTIVSAYPPTEDIGEFLSVLATYATKYGVTASVNVGGATPSAISIESVALQTVTMTIDVKGAKSAVRGYIADVERLPYFFSFTTLNERADPARPDSREDILNGTLWTKPQQTLTQSAQ